MFGRALMGLTVAMVVIVGGSAPVHAQLSGRVVVDEGPIAVDVVFGPEHRVTGRTARVNRRVVAPVRYRVGMGLPELEWYLAQIEYELDLYRRMNWRDAYYRLGWTRDQLRDYVRFLRDERKFLRDERRRLERLYRAEARRTGHPGRGRGLARGRGRGLATGLAHSW